MGRLILFILASISSVLSESKIEPEKGLRSFYKYDIVPTILPEAPAYLLTVTFPNNVKVLQGNVLELTKIVFKPTIASDDVDPASNYTLIEFDPDVPARGKNLITLLHWMIVNIPGSNLKGGHTVANFLNSTPPPGSGQTINRIKFSPQTFACENNLGPLVAGNFYRAGTAQDITAVVTFTNTNVEVLEGNIVDDLTKILFAPTFEWEDVDPAKNYTLIEIDPDVPARGKNSLTLLHWMIVNIPGSNLKGGHTVAKFLNSMPPPGSGYHRYIFLLYEQNPNVVVNEVLQQTINRLDFSPQTFADNNDLGALVAGNFYQAGIALDVTAIKL